MQTNIDLQPKKLSSRKKQSTKNADNIKRILLNDWNPFERADPSVLEKVKREFTKRKNYEYEDALL